MTVTKPLRVGLSIHQRYPKQYRTKSWSQLYQDEIELVVHADRITPHTEGFAAVVWHLLVSHPALKVTATKWESTK